MDDRDSITDYGRNFSHLLHVQTDILGAFGVILDYSHLLDNGAMIL
jgi:hypothetical protein